MKIFIIVSLALISSVKVTFGQNNLKLDSLLNKLNSLQQDTDKINLLIDIGSEYEKKSSEKAIEIFAKALNISKNIDNKNFMANCLELLGNIYSTSVAQYDSAEYYYSSCANVRKKIFGENSINYANSLSNLALIYKNMGNYILAEQIYLKEIKILTEIKNTNTTDYAYSLNGLADLYKLMGNYSKAEPLYIEASKIWKDNIGEKDQQYAISLYSIASLYRIMNNYSKAEPLYKAASEIFKETLGTEHPYYAISQNGLAVLYQDIGRFSEAEPLFLEAQLNAKKIFGIKHPYYANSLSNLGGLYLEMKDYKKAETYLLDALEILKQVLGEEHPYYASSLNAAAVLYFKLGNFAKAESMFLESTNIRKQILGEKHPEYINSINNLAILYQEMGNYDKAESLFIEGLSKTNDNILTNFSFLSESEKEKYFEDKTSVFTNFYSFAMRRKLASPKIIDLVCNNVIKNKGLLLKSSSAMRTSIINCNDSVLISKFNEWTNLKKEISKLYTIAINKRSQDPDILENKANQIEKELVIKSNIFSNFNKIVNLDWKDVQRLIKPDEAALEFIHFKYGTDSVLYCALLITSKCTHPDMIPLFEEHELNQIIEKISNRGYDFVEKMYGTNQQPNLELYKIIWKPLETYLHGVKTVYYAPDGILHKVSFAAIAKNKKKYLCDIYTLKQISTSGKIAFPENYIFEKHPSIAIFGGINYNTKNTKIKYWNYLPGTKIETDEIVKKFYNSNLQYFTGDSASEINFKSIAQNYSILHIATHGFFFPDPKIMTRDSLGNYLYITELFGGLTRGFGIWSFVQNEQPLLRSGLAFSGANNVWINKTADSGEDGVLTASEVSQMNLQGTQLVVLSACETGLGDIKGSEGVYGLQRAFKMAGVKYIIMSLWQVPDKETVEFMTTFYSKLLKQKDIRKAFTETQNEMRKKYDPYYWAAFVLIE